MSSNLTSSATIVTDVTRMPNQFETCLAAHPYYLGTIRLWVLPPSRLNLISAELRQDLLTFNGLVLHNYSAALTLGMNIQEPLARSIAPDLANAVHALLALHGKEYQRALGYAEKAVLTVPDCAEYIYLVGIIAAQARDLPLCVAACQRSLALQPDFGFALAALALIYTLNHEWEKALDFARRAKAHTGNKIYYVDLCLLACCWRLALPNESSLLFDTLENSSDNTETLFNWLPPVTWHLDPDKLKGCPYIFFVYGDIHYLFEHIVPLAWSLADVGGRAVHLHIHIAANPHPFLPQVIEELHHRSGLSISWSTETLDPFSYGHLKVYHSSVRFYRFLQFIERIQLPAYSIDADSLFHRHPEEFSLFWDNDCELALQYKADHPLWEQCVAIGVFVRPTTKALMYLKHVASFILYNIQAGRGRWFLDQIGLSLVFDRMKDQLKFTALPFEIFSDQGHGDEAMVWSVTVEKNADDRYNHVKKRLLAHYGDLRSFLEEPDPSPHPFIWSLFGSMFLGDGDEDVQKRILSEGLIAADQLMLLWRHVRKGDCVLDIGAHPGMHSLAFASWVGIKGTVLSFEKDPRRRALLDKSFDHNGWSQASCHGATAPLFLNLDSCRLIRIGLEDDIATLLMEMSGCVQKHRPLIYAVKPLHMSSLQSYLQKHDYRCYVHSVKGAPQIIGVPTEMHFDADGLREVTVSFNE